MKQAFNIAINTIIIAILTYALPALSSIPNPVHMGDDDIAFGARVIKFDEEAKKDITFISTKVYDEGLVHIMKRQYFKMFGYNENQKNYFLTDRDRAYYSPGAYREGTGLQSQQTIYGLKTVFYAVKYNLLKKYNYYEANNYMNVTSDNRMRYYFGFSEDNGFEFGGKNYFYGMRDRVILYGGDQTQDWDVKVDFQKQVLGQSYAGAGYRVIKSEVSFKLGYSFKEYTYAEISYQKSFGKDPQKSILISFYNFI